MIFFSVCFSHLHQSQLLMASVSIKPLKQPPGRFLLFHEHPMRLKRYLSSQLCFVRGLVFESVVRD